MNIRSRLFSWWKALAHRPAMENELEEELRFHIDSYTEDLVRSGVPREQALRQARLELGATISQKEKVRFSLGLRPWDDLRSDLRYAVRQLRQNPAFTITVLLVLALGIGANAAMFSIIDVTLLRWLPYHRPGQLINLGVTDAHGADSWIFFADVEEWQKEAHTLEGLAYYTDDSVSAETPNGERTLLATQVSANLFSVLGVQPMLGRGFQSGDQSGGERVVVLSEAVWRTLFAADRRIVGKLVKLNGEPHTVVGVMPKSFLFPANTTQPQVWVPAVLSENSRKRDFSSPPYHAIARQKSGVPISTVTAELSAIQKRLAHFYTGPMAKEAPVNVTAALYRDTLVQDARPALRALLVAVATIWLIACANVANLTLARATARQRELAVREALGASRWRVVRQLFTESLVLSMAGAVAGLALAQLALRFFNKTLRARLDLPEHLAPNLTVLAALLVLSVLSALLFGLFPALMGGRTSLEQSLRQSSQQASRSHARHRAQQAMVVAEIGLSLVLLVGCGLMLRTVFALRRVPLGFRTDHVLLIEPVVPTSRYRGVDVPRAIYRPLLKRVQQTKGVQAAALTTVVPLHGGFISQLSLYIGKSNDAKNRIDAQLKATGPELQDVLGFRMYQGRYFNRHDTADSQLVIVVNRAFARLYAPDGYIVGKRMFGRTKEQQAEIVGVIDDFHQASIGQPAMPEVDFCTTQLREGHGFYQPTMQAHIELAVHASQEPSAVISDLRRVMAEVTPDLQTSNIETMDQVVEDSMGSQLLAAHLLQLFAGTALVVALAGLYGLLTYLVTQRTQEFGIRLALGAQRGNIMGMLLRQAAGLLTAGATIGVVLAYFSNRLLSTFLYGVHANDALTIVGVTAVLVLSGLIAASVPAMRASQVDPMHALRSE